MTAGRKPVREVDIAGRSQVTRIVTWSSLGGVIGGLLGLFGMVQGVWGVREVLLFAGIAWAISFVVPFTVSTVFGRAARLLYSPSGRTTPRAQGYSQAQSLAARGRYADGVAAFEAAIREDPADPVPYLEVARIYRDGLKDLEAAAAWFKRALSEPRLSPEADAFARRALVELYVAKMKQPERAAPVLARMAEELAGTEAGRWAEAELRRVRADIVDRGAAG